MPPDSRRRESLFVGWDPLQQLPGGLCGEVRRRRVSQEILQQVPGSGALREHIAGFPGQILGHQADAAFGGGTEPGKTVRTGTGSEGTGYNIY